MTRDLFIGIAVSILLHVGFLFGGELLSSGPEEVAVVEEEPVIELMEMPPIEPEEPEIVEVTDDALPEEVPDIAPPMLADVPAQVQVDSFVQKIQPPPPPGSEHF